MSAKSHVLLTLPLAFLAAACAAPGPAPEALGTITLDCAGGLDADCDAQAFAACPKGYEHAERAAGRPGKRAIRCRP